MSVGWVKAPTPPTTPQTNPLFSNKQNSHAQTTKNKTKNKKKNKNRPRQPPTIPNTPTTPKLHSTRPNACSQLPQRSQHRQKGVRRYRVAAGRAEGSRGPPRGQGQGLQTQKQRLSRMLRVERAFYYLESLSDAMEPKEGMAPF